MEKIRGLKSYSEKIRGLKILGLSDENTPGGYSPLKMSAPLTPQVVSRSYLDCMEISVAVDGGCNHELLFDLMVESCDNMFTEGGCFTTPWCKLNDVTPFFPVPIIRRIIHVCQFYTQGSILPSFMDRVHFFWRRATFE